MACIRGRLWANGSLIGAAAARHADVLFERMAGTQSMKKVFAAFRLLSAVTMLCFWQGPVMAAAEPRLHVYLLGAQHCEFCQRAGEFARRLQVSDGRFVLTELDIERSSEDAELYVRVLLDIGLREPVIPMVIIGPHVLLGFDADETSGREIVKFIDTCLTEACPDFVAELRATTPAAHVHHGWRIERRWGAAAQKP